MAPLLDFTGEGQPVDPSLAALAEQARQRRAMGVTDREYAIALWAAWAAAAQRGATE